MADDQTTQTDAADTAATQTATDAGKTFTQADVDKIIADRLAREQRTRDKAIADAVAAGVQAELDKQKLSNEERLKLEKDEATKQAADIMAKATARLLTAEAKAQALAAGANPEYLDDVLALANIAGDKYLKDGEPDGDAIKAAIAAVIDKRPFYKAGAPSNFGSEFGGGKTPPSKIEQLKQQIADANKAGDFAASIALTDKLSALQSAGQ